MILGVLTGAATLLVRTSFVAPRKQMPCRAASQ